MHHGRKGGYPCGVKATKQEWIVSLFYHHRLKSAQAGLKRDWQSFIILGENTGQQVMTSASEGFLKIHKQATQENITLKVGTSLHLENTIKRKKEQL